MISQLDRLIWLRQRGFSPHDVLDIGAHKGDWARMFLTVFPEARMFMVEADPRHEPHLKTVGFPYHLGLAGKFRGEAEFFTQEDSHWTTGASIYRENSELYEKSPVITRLPVERLDDIAIKLGVSAANFIKLDVQGAEIDVLEGASGLLSANSVDYILAEMSIAQTNQGAPLADAVIGYMRSIGYGIFDIYELHYWQDRLLQFDVLFARDQLITPVALPAPAIQSKLVAPSTTVLNFSTPVQAMYRDNPLRIGIHSEQFDGRGSGKVPLDYGVSLRKLLGHDPLFITAKHKPNEGLSKITNQFPVVLYDQTEPSDIREELARIIDNEKLDFLYMVKSGQNDGKTPDNCRTGVHCVFLMNEPHGTVYAGVSEFLARRFGMTAYVPHIIKNFPPTENLRKKLNIPEEALIVGRCGGTMTFNVAFVKQVIKLVLEHRKDIFFLFLSTDKFIEHERVIHLPWVETEQEKFNFIHTCDMMLHARHGGESFGLAVGEFSVANKPVITWSGMGDPHPHDKSHLETLAEKAILYNNAQDLMILLMGITKDMIRAHDWDKYSEKFSEASVIRQFNDVFLTA